MELDNPLSMFGNLKIDSVLTDKVGYLNTTVPNGTAHFKKGNNHLNTNIYSFLETCGGQSSNPYLNVVHFLNASIK
jgi:hypothetical protein